MFAGIALVDRYGNSQTLLTTGVFTINGFSFAGQGQNAGLVFVNLKPWDERSGADNKAQERKIVVGVRQGDNQQIVSGVQEGEKVVVAGGLGLENKAKVKIVEPPAADADDDDDDK